MYVVYVLFVVFVLFVVYVVYVVYVLFVVYVVSAARPRGFASVSLREPKIPRGYAARLRIDGRPCGKICATALREFGMVGTGAMRYTCRKNGYAQTPQSFDTMDSQGAL